MLVGVFVEAHVKVGCLHSLLLIHQVVDEFLVHHLAREILLHLTPLEDLEIHLFGARAALHLDVPQHASPPELVLFQPKVSILGRVRSVVKFLFVS